MADAKRLFLKRKGLYIDFKDEVARDAITKTESDIGSVQCPCADNFDYSYTDVTDFSIVTTA